MAADRRVRTVRVAAFAKINLSLRILDVRTDGYHALRTRFQSLALHDSLTFTQRPGPFAIACDDPSCPVDESNLVWRAAARLWRVARTRGAVTGVGVRISKRIPMQAGLGGGSSDAAAAIRALMTLWHVDMPAPRVRRIAAELGADVPFFLHGGTALGVERGDVVIPNPDGPQAWVVLVVPAFGVSTAEAFGWWDEDRRAAGFPTSDGADEPGNDLEGPVSRRHPQIARVATRLNRLGSFRAAMSGSGSAVFGLFRTRHEAEAAAAGFSGRSRRVLVTRTIGRQMYKKLSQPRSVR
jgi:4-diphosphocytidyl-2-C-methyl-D-erythritol kinase